MVKKKVSSGERPKGPIGNAEMLEALSTDATYDHLDQWILDIGNYARDTDVTETIRAMNKNVTEDIYYTKLFMMEYIAAVAKKIEPALLDRMVALFIDHFLRLMAAGEHFRPSKQLEINAITNGLYLQHFRNNRDAAGFVSRLLQEIPRENFEQASFNTPKMNVPLLVAMKALEEDVNGAEWAFLQALEFGYDRVVFYNDSEKRWDFKFVFNRVLDRMPKYGDYVEYYLPQLRMVHKTVADPEVVESVLFALTNIFSNVIDGHENMSGPVLRDMFNAMAGLAEHLRPDAKLADRFPKKMWEGLSEAMNATRLDGESKEFFAGVLRGEQGKVSRSIEGDIDKQLKDLRSSTAPNERFFAVDKLRSMVVVNLVPLSAEIREKVFAAMLEEAEKETDRIVRNGLIDLVVQAGGERQFAAVRELLERHLDDGSWNALSGTQVNLEPYGDLYYKEFPTRTMAMIAIVTKGMGQPVDEALRALCKRLEGDPNADIRCLSYGYLLATSDGEDFHDVVWGLIKSGIPFRGALSEELRPLFGPEPLQGGIEFNVKESEAKGLVEFLKGKYPGATEDEKARMRRILIQSPSVDLKDMLLLEYRRVEQDRAERMTDYWLQLRFLSEIGPKYKGLFNEKDDIFVRAYTQVRIEHVLEDGVCMKRLLFVDVFKVMKALGLKVAPMKLVNAVLNERMVFEDAIHGLDRVSEGDYDIFLNETVELFSKRLDGIERRLQVILTQFVPYIRTTHTEWYEKKWHSIMLQMVMNHDFEGKYMGFWSERDRDLAYMWVKDDAQSDNLPRYIAILWNISDENFKLKKAVPAIVKNWRDDAILALGGLERLDEPLDVVSTDKAMAMLYDNVWKKHEKSRGALMDRWWSTEHFGSLLKDYKKAKGGKKDEIRAAMNLGLFGLRNALANRYYEGRFDPDTPLKGTAPMVKAVGEVFDNVTGDLICISTPALYCLLAGGWEPFLAKADAYMDLIEAEKGSGQTDELKHHYSDEENDNTLAGILLKAIQKGHVEALRPLIRLLDSGLVSGMEGWAGADGKYTRLLELVAAGGFDTEVVSKALEGHQEMQVEYIMKLRSGAKKAEGRPKPSDFGANEIIYDI